MYLHIGGGVMLPDDGVVGVFDLDNTTAASRDTRAFLSRAEREGRLENAADDLPKSFVVCREKTWLSQLAPATLLRRSGLSVAELTKTG